MNMKTLENFVNICLILGLISPGLVYPGYALSLEGWKIEEEITDLNKLCNCEKTLEKEGSKEETIKKNLAEIRKEIMDNSAHWQANYTSVFSPFTNNKMGNLGLIDDEISEYETVTFSGEIPDSFDWRNKNGSDWTTPVKNQNGCGSCTAFGIIGALESIIQIHVGKPFKCDLSEAHLFFCGGGSCKKGMKISEAIKYLKIFGIVAESCYPYSLQETGCNSLPINWENQTVKINYANKISPSFDNIKNALLRYGPLVTSLNVYEDFYAYNKGVYSHVWGDFCGRHCVTIVGYDNRDGYWICKNSWGDQWGENGWFRIGYGQCDIGDPTYYFSGISGNIQPYHPYNIEPFPDAKNILCNTTLKWGCSDFDSDELYFDIYMAEGYQTDEFNLIQSHHNYPYFHLNNLKRNTTYTWKIIAKDEHGSKTEGETWQFTTVENIPPTVKITTPQKGYLHWRKTKIPLPFPIPIIIGEIHLQGRAYDTSGIKNVNFYVNGIHKETINHEPYWWKWEEHSLGLKTYTIRLTAYDIMGNHASDEMTVRAFNPRHL